MASPPDIDQLLADFDRDSSVVTIRRALCQSKHPETAHRLLDMLTPAVVVTRQRFAEQIISILKERSDARATPRTLLRLIEIWAFYPHLRRSIEQTAPVGQRRLYVTGPHSQLHVSCRPHEHAMLPTSARPGRSG